MRRRAPTDSGRGWIVLRAVQLLRYVEHGVMAADDRVVRRVVAQLTPGELTWVRRVATGENVGYGSLHDIITRRFGPFVEPVDERLPLTVGGE